MMKRTKGVTLTEIMEVTGWQKRTVRGVAASTVDIRGGLSDVTDV